MGKIIVLLGILVFWNVMNAYIVYVSVLHFEKATYVYAPSPSVYDNYGGMVKKPEDDWVIPGYLDP